MLRQIAKDFNKISLLRRSICSAAPAPSVSIRKEALMKLRKRTGYSYANCRKALVKFGEENIAEAEKWLAEQARSEGWTKAAKLGNRETTQGLVAVKSTGSIAAIVKLGCETDFVARGDNFKNLLQKLVTLVLDHAQKNVPPSLPEKIKTVGLELQSLTDGDGEPVSETIAMAVGKLGENITVRGISVLYGPENSSLYSFAHPKENVEGVDMGKFVSVIALRREQAEGLFPTDKLASQLCQHVIGMRSETLGEPPEEKTVKQSRQADESRDELNDFADVQSTTIDEDETALLRQAFMLNPSQSVYEYVKEHQAEIVDFVRSELSNAE